MKKRLFKSLFLLACLFNLCAVNPSDLIKVTNETQKSCVEYYSYQGEAYCSTRALSPQVVTPEIKSYETQKIVFDHRPWQAAWGKKTDDSVTVEYVPMGEDINNWNELVTSQVFWGLQDKVTPKEFANLILKNIKEAGFDPVVTFILDTPDTVIFEYRISSPKNQIQDEIQKISKGKDGLYVLHYVIKKSDMGEQARKTWVKNLSESK